jgi:hypothetical protein
MEKSNLGHTAKEFFFLQRAPQDPNLRQEELFNR